ncbi:hypothetical protein COCC4DRAFT_208302 [Bipolaris maydis ATCC 48331]|uniref:Uncharacterized protein n=2 Tax=Cochliobolus heterostrophus TaxID=5016 RepID=M2T7Y2_COCH5|nr:uncharacterized protein COCC4DRAFT_208302 [Bipolaris maydis ATCC 48331]EMD93695.1 hypothetical protein COCHEDRAFT_1171722 [Bipolaris maydis C5]KAJ5027985.1 hypothetical protein J3E73DRAFT_229783 [Bipolaris maydis]ENH99269.1 hypothetical protein COCC4DRAFT_208302 [Bipolaris maydis ATCC 48331]KAJ6204927.1 hypothetical protein PSV09DRAFT_1171722 [Bipolaris maydis]KAJ6265398.1 hypothetical protein PSV08DRAFT_233310 [Bipolaris maydis]
MFDAAKEPRASGGAGSRTYTGERPLDRTLFILLSLGIVTMSSLLLGCGQGLYTYNLCLATTWVCLVLYALTKSVIYIFLVERIHVVRAPFFTRSHDWVYIGSMLFMMTASAGIVINAWLHPYTAMDPKSGRCHTGIQRKVTVPFLIIDIVMDIVLTVVFFYLLQPVLKQNGNWSLPIIFGGSKTRAGMVELEGSNDTAVQRSIRSLLQKSIIGAFAITIVTLVLFIVQYFFVEGKGVALVCSTICLVDVFWGYVIIHWLTDRASAEAEKDISCSSGLTISTQRIDRLPA